jgi:hypothetical protein
LNLPLTAVRGISADVTFLPEGSKGPHQYNPKKSFEPHNAQIFNLPLLAQTLPYSPASEVSNRRIPDRWNQSLEAKGKAVRDLDVEALHRVRLCCFKANLEKSFDRFQTRQHLHTHLDAYRVRASRATSSLLDDSRLTDSH